MAWLRLIPILVMKLILKFIALFVYPVIDKKNNPLFGVRDAKDFGYHNIAVRNSCHNFKAVPQVKYIQRGNVRAMLDWSLEEIDGFQWRIRKSVARPGIDMGEYVSLRITFGKTRDNGKKEFYFGWTMNEDKFMRPTIQLRPF